MKQFFLLTIVLLPLLSVSQSRKVKNMMDEIEGQWQVDKDNNLMYQRIIEVPGQSASDLFTRAENYFVYNYESGKDVIQTKDKEKGLIIGKGLWSDVHLAIAPNPWHFNAFHVVRLDVKEGRARATLTVHYYDIFVEFSDEKFSFDLKTQLADSYPIVDARDKTMYGKAFYSLHHHCLESLASIEKALKVGNVQVANDDW
jgi:hypothetical protein